MIGYSDNTHLRLEAQGSGGISDLISHLKDDEVNYGYLRVTFKEEETTRTKFVLITWKGEKASVLRKVLTFIVTNRVIFSKGKNECTQGIS